MTIYNATYVNQNQINAGTGEQGTLSLANNGTMFVFTPQGGDSFDGTVTYSTYQGDGIYNLDGYPNYFFRSLNNVLPSQTGGTWIFEGDLPLVALNINTPDIETPAGITSDLLRTDSSGAKYYLAKAMNWTLNGSSTGITVTGQNVDIAIDSMTEAEIETYIATELQNYILSSEVTTMLSSYVTSSALATALADYATSTDLTDGLSNKLEAADLNTLSVDITTSENLTANRITVNEKLTFADGSTIEQVTIN